MLLRHEGLSSIGLHVIGGLPKGGSSPLSLLMHR